MGNTWMLVPDVESVLTAASPWGGVSSDQVVLGIPLLCLISKKSKSRCLCPVQLLHISGNHSAAVCGMGQSTETELLQPAQLAANCFAGVTGGAGLGH